MNYLEAALLGLIQGITEFLPVSSSGHLELAKAIFGKDIEEGLLLSVVLHMATALSTLIVFRKDIWILLSTLFGQSKRYLIYIIISMIPAALVGLFFESYINHLFDGNALLVAVMLMVTGTLLWFSDKIKNSNHTLRAKHAFWVGWIQAIAILPGISRSGSTVGALLLMGINRKEAAKFSFLMVLPVILGAALKKSMDFVRSGEPVSIDIGPMILGFIVAFLSGFFACKGMLFLIDRTKLRGFAYYCWGVACMAILLVFLGS